MTDAHFGVLAGICAAVAWAVAGTIFSRVPVSAAAMNFFKNTVSAAIAFVILLVLAVVDAKAAVSLAAGAWIYLSLSGFCGIVIGDTCYLRSLQILGARRGFVVSTVTPVFAALVGWIWLGESPAWTTLLGIVVLLGGIIAVVLEPGGEAEGAGHYPGSTTRGVLYGALGSLGQAVGAALAKLGMRELPSESPFEATFIRLVTAAALGLLFALPMGVGSWPRAFAKHWPRLLPASVIGTLVGITCSLIAFKYTDIAVATALTSMTPVFAIPLVWWFLGQRVTSRAVLGAIVAVAGVVIIGNSLR